MRNTSEDTVRCRFFAPIEQALRAATSGRRCPEFPDAEHVASGIGRAIANVQSGRDWVQRSRHADSGLSVSNFFHSLRSARRLRHLEEVARLVRQQVDGQVPDGLDPLAAHAELADFAVYGADGHYEKPSAHARTAELKGEPVGYFYSINLSSHSLRLLDIARPVRKREHDMAALKRLGSTALRMGEPKGTKVLHVYDPAAIDYAQWLQWKAKGVYIISREKENSAAQVVGDTPWDQNDLRNIGVLADELVGVFCGALLRRVRYCDPATGKEYAFMTSEMTLPPGLIAFLYKLRWDVEKFFDEKKNKLLEKKAWAATAVARCQQAQFVCLAHNLMLLFERCLQCEEGITDEKAQAKRAKRAARLEAQIQQLGRTPNPLVQQCTRITQRSLQFIRWLRHALTQPTSWRAGVETLRPLMQGYLT